MVLWPVVGGAIMYASVFAALLMARRAYVFPSKLVLVNLLGLVVSMFSSLDAVLSLLAVGLLLAIYAMMWAAFLLSYRLHQWMYELDFKTYRRSFLGLDTVVFHLYNNPVATMNLTYMACITSFFYARLVLGWAPVVQVAYIVSTPILLFLIVKSLDKGYLRLVERKNRSRG